jgi:hypothetical protein
LNGRGVDGAATFTFFSLATFGAAGLAAAAFAGAGFADLAAGFAFAESAIAKIK